MWANVTSDIYPLCPLINIPHPEWAIISQPKTEFPGVVFDVGHDFRVPEARAPKAHLDAVNSNLSRHLGHPPYVVRCVPRAVKNDL